MSSPVTSNPPLATTTPFISVVIPACNPGMRHFEVVLEALRNQTLPKDRWELIVVDDASRTPLKAAPRREAERSAVLALRAGKG
jgi:cellulose synthase/poly-beta-1,6-N-acetylglucosamine synthase-like glycosyltransferase